MLVWLHILCNSDFRKKEKVKTGQIYRSVGSCCTSGMLPEVVPWHSVWNRVGKKKQNWPWCEKAFLMCPGAFWDGVLWQINNNAWNGQKQKNPKAWSRKLLREYSLIGAPWTNLDSFLWHAVISWYLLNFSEVNCREFVAQLNHFTSWQEKRKSFAEIIWNLEPCSLENLFLGRKLCK